MIDIDIDGLRGKGVCCVALCVFAQEGATLDSLQEATAFLKLAFRGGGFKDAAIVPVGDGLGQRATGVCVAALFSPDGGHSFALRRMGQTFLGPTDFLEGEKDLVGMCVAAGVITKVPPLQRGKLGPAPCSQEGHCFGACPDASSSLSPPSSATGATT